jgi:hypothetical protein
MQLRVDQLKVSCVGKVMRRSDRCPYVLVLGLPQEQRSICVGKERGPHGARFRLDRRQSIVFSLRRICCCIVVV